MLLLHSTLLLLLMRRGLIMWSWLALNSQHSLLDVFLQLPCLSPLKLQLHLHLGPEVKPGHLLLCSLSVPPLLVHPALEVSLRCLLSCPLHQQQAPILSSVCVTSFTIPVPHSRGQCLPAFLRLSVLGSCCLRTIPLESPSCF